MVTRNLTEVFVLMRNNAIHSKQIFFDQSGDGDTERVQLMRNGGDFDVESGMDRGQVEASPPPWLDTLEEAHYVVSRIRTKLSDLQECQDRHLKRPSLDSADQQRIDRLATEVGKHFNMAHRALTEIKSHNQIGSKLERLLATNVVKSLVTTLQDLSVTYRTGQSIYLKSLTTREERTKALLELPNFEELSLDDNPERIPNLNTDLLFLPSTSNSNGLYDNTDSHIVNQQQLLIAQESDVHFVAEREVEVSKIVKSIVELSDVFKDLSTMVHDQGTILDRIDYNIEQTTTQVYEGYTELKKAEKYTNSKRRCQCYVITAVTVIMSFILLIVFN